MRRTVLLPDPLGPRRAVILPSSARNSTSSTALNDAEALVESLRHDPVAHWVVSFVAGLLALDELDGPRGARMTRAPG